MRSADLARMALTSLSRHGRRTVLSLLGVAIGVAAVVVLTAAGEGARGFVTAQFEALGSHVLAVLPGKVETKGAIPGFGGVPNDLTLADAETVRVTILGVQRVVPISTGNDTLARGGRSRQVLALGTTIEFKAMRDLTVRSGSFLPDVPWDRGSAVAVIGSNLAKELFPDEQAVGGRVRLGGWRLTVIGVLAPQGVTFGMNMDETVLLPVATCMQMFNRSTLFRLAIQMQPSSDMELAEKRVTALLAKRHGEEDFTITTPDAVIGTLNAIMGAITLALAGIAGVSLSVAGIGIMNVMLVTVSERRSEIGLLKAIGAERRQVLAVFLTEAALISLAGGLAGLGVGWGAVRAFVWKYPTFPASPPAWAVVAALVLALGTGVFFGYWPARQAVRLDPVKALGGG